MINYHNKIFKTVRNSDNGETSSETEFRYQQEGNILTSVYKGGRIVYGHLLGIVHEDSSITMKYHQINKQGELLTGQCHSIPELMPNGKIRLHETWQWTSGDLSEGTSVIEEV
ncbi:hypothetical protein [Zhouia amylolytica]|uniref:N-acetylglutamate synthase n=1 Tax=Zhouia amylolytica AD3 TaxID=1286632 RepID=W2UKT1_9FLAO|nr:hypothetical protein [Zhouia amylolytica]ETN94056.1 hypothetical protein P278_28600 [Zhouia amylolytica AD3]